MVRAPFVSQETCPVCRGPSPPLYFVKNGYPIHKCAACELVYSARPPEGADLEALYSAQYFTGGGAGYPDYIGDERTHRRQARTYMKRIAKLRNPGCLLDVGCAAGFFLDEARSQGWIVKGCELSEFAHQHAVRELGLDVDRAGLLDPKFSPKPQSFDVITLFNVLEHIPNPTAVANKVFGLLRPGGHLVIEAWDPAAWLARILGPRWPTYAPPTVLYCFGKKTLQQLFEPELWTLESYRPAIKWISVEHGLSLLEYEAKNTILAPVMRTLRQSWLGRIDVPYCLGDLALAVFRRTTSVPIELEESEVEVASTAPMFSPGLPA